MKSALRIETAHAGAYSGASAADLERLVSQLDNEHRHVVVHREPDDGSFAQAFYALRERGGITVEYSLKSGKLRRTLAKGHAEAFDLLCGWAFNTAGWKASHTWESVANDEVVDFLGGCEWSEIDGELIVSFPPLGIEGRGGTREQATAALMFALEDATTSSSDVAKSFSDWAQDHVVRRSEIRR